VTDIVGPALLLLSALPVLILAFLFWMSVREGARLRSALFGLSLVHEFLLVCWPVWYSVFADYRLERDIGVSPGQLLTVMLGESIFVGAFALAFSAWRLREEPIRFVPATGTDRDESRVDRFFLYLLVFAGLAIHSAPLFSPVEGLAVVTQHAEIAVPSTLGGVLWGWFRGALGFPALVAAAIIVAVPTFPRLMRIIGLSVLLVIAAVGVSSGVRGRVTWVVSLLIVVGLLMNSRRVALFAILALLVFAPFSSFLAGTFRSIYFSELTGSSPVDALKRVASESMKSGPNPNRDDEAFISGFYRRAQGPRNSAILYRLRDASGGVGLGPIEGALYLPIPRSLWPAKRPAGSVDDTNYGSAVFIVRRVGYDAPFYNMGPILASGHAYWEGGWIWLIIAGALTGIFWRIAAAWSARQGPYLSIVFCLSFASALLIDGFMTTLYPAYALIDVVWAVIVPLVAIRAGVTLLARLNRAWTKPGFRAFVVPTR
jgi:hypothetical protein